jgi:membrane protein required for colicin V production|tara:strand:+ start:678 stop:1220 length:543 start_codon:yes stop_codon:yes gene_type:complete
MEEFFKIFKGISTFDLIYIFFTILSLIKCSRKGFVLSLLAASKWLLAYVLTLIAFPKVKPFVDGIIDNEYVLDVFLGVGIFVLIIFIILMINKGIGKAVTYSGLGTLDKVFGFFFGFLRSYIICVCIFSTITIVYNHEKWPLNLDKSFTFSIVEKGSNYLIKEFPNQENYNDAKEKVQEL